MRTRFLIPALAVVLTGFSANAQYAGDYCREFTAPVHVGGRIQQGYGTACMQPDGSWQVVQAPSSAPNYAPPPQVQYVQPPVVQYAPPQYIEYARPHRPYYPIWPIALSFSFANWHGHDGWGGGYHDGGGHHWH